jgi:hypothetical protein
MIDTANNWLVSFVPSNDGIVILNRNMLLARRLTKEEALNLAGWLVAMADPTRKDFDPLLKAILET